MQELTTKQFGDAVEHLVIGRLGLAAIPATKMPDCWPGYDLIAQIPDNDRPLRISVKGLRAGNGKPAGFWYFTPGGCDWLVFVRYNTETDTLRCYLLPHDKAVELSAPATDGRRRLLCNHVGLQPYADNFRLAVQPDCPAASNIDKSGALNPEPVFEQ